MGVDNLFWLRHDQRSHALQVLHMSGQCTAFFFVFHTTNAQLYKSPSPRYLNYPMANLFSSLQDLGANVFTGLSCTPNPVFVPHAYQLPSLGLLPRTIHIAPMQFHILFFATFASLIAPFGGFFASGLKRTFKIKDFGESIPGHGGITDRMDCQFIMGFFAFMYYQSFIAVHQASVGGVIETAVHGLSNEEVAEVVRGLSKYLVAKGAAGEGILECLSAEMGWKKR